MNPEDKALQALEKEFEQVVTDEYTRLFFQQWKKLVEINEEIERLTNEREKLGVLLQATYNMMPEKEKEIFAEVRKTFQTRTLGLTAAVREVLQSNVNSSFYATEIRDALAQKGFDFSSYTSNPLSSIHSVLKRFKKSEVKVIEHLDGKTSYKWRGKIKELPPPPAEPPTFDYKQALAEIQRQSAGHSRKPTVEGD